MYRIRYKVEAWQKTKKGRELIITDELYSIPDNGKEVARAFGAKHGIPEKAWLDVGPSPLVVIRIFEEGTY